MKIEYVGTTRSRTIGLVAILLTWISAAISVPKAKVLQDDFSSQELLIIRSIFCLFVAMLFSNGRAWRTTSEIVLAGFIIGFSSYMFYGAIESLGVNATAVLVTFIPAVNLAIVLIEGKRVSNMVATSLAVLIGGTCWALELWNQSLPTEGLVLMGSCIVMSAIGFHYWGRAPDEVTVSQKCFWLSVAGLVLALPFYWIAPFTIGMQKYGDQDLLETLFQFTITVIAYIFFSTVPYSRVGKMHTVLASALSQAGMPFIIVGSSIFAHEHLKPSQWPGVILALAGAIALSTQTYYARPPEEK